MKTKVKIFFAIFPFLLILVLAFRSGFNISDIFTQLANFCGSNGFYLGTLQTSIHNLFFNWFGIGEFTSSIFAWFFSYFIFVGLGFMLYDLFLWFGSFVKTFRK